jgi:hypothetical protein
LQVRSGGSGRRKRVSARHQVKRLDRILERVRSFKNRSGRRNRFFFVRCGSHGELRSFTGPKPQVKSGPDVFADALVPVTAPLAPVFDFPKFISDRPLTWTRRFDTCDRVKQIDGYLAPMPADSRGIRGHGNFPSVAGAFGMPDYRDSACHRAGVAPDRPKDDHP